MSFDSRSGIPSHLLALGSLAQWHANQVSQPLEMRFTVNRTRLSDITCAVTGKPSASVPAEYLYSATVAIYEIAQNHHFDGAFTVRINAAPGGQAIIKQIPLAVEDEGAVEEAAEHQAAPVSANGLQLRAALLERGHSSGYSVAEIAAEERWRGFTFTPELRFYRALVRSGVVAERGQHQIVASPVQADFGAAAIESFPWRAPETTDSAVQAVLKHDHWVEIAHDPEYLYALDLAPASAGVPGQVIARRKGEASVPVQVAHSLAQFVTGNYSDGTDAAPSTPAAVGASKGNQLAQTVAWAGEVEPLALPDFLGWALAPGKQRYETVLSIITAGQLRAEDPTEAVEPKVAAPTVPASVTVVESVPAPPAQEASHVAAQPTVQEVRPAPAAPVLIRSTTPHASVATLFAATGSTAAIPDPSSDDKHQAAPVAANEPAPEAEQEVTTSIAARAKKIHPQETITAQEEESENHPLRSALRKLFIG